MKQNCSIPLWIIVAGSLLLAYLAFFVAPVFLNPAHTMAFPRYIQATAPMGVDLRWAYDSATALASGLPSSRAPIGYPPMERVLRVPLLPFSFSQAYALHTFVTVLAFLSVVLALPLLIRRQTDRTVLVMMAISGLLSYGFQFEMERGQCYVIAMAMVAVGLFLFHRSHGLFARLSAYVLFTFAIQLKLTPAIFVFAFTDDARDWKRNLMRWGTLGLMNIACLFIFGIGEMQKFVATVTDNCREFMVSSNHSILSCANVAQMAVGGNRQSGFQTVEAMRCAAQIQHVIPPALQQVVGRIVEVGGYLILGLSLGCVLWLSFRRNARPVFKYLIMICCLTMLLLPAVSLDYTLSVLPMALGVFLGESDALTITGWRGKWRVGLMAALGLLYACILFPPIFRPKILASSTPALLGMCIVIALLMMLEDGRVRPSGAGVPPETR